MQRYSIYQIEVTPAMRKLVNEHGRAALNEFQELAAFKAKQDLMFDGSRFWEHQMFRHFHLAGQADAESLDEVFELTNLWNRPEQVTRYPSMHSTSVGDIIVDEAGDMFMVDGIGFTHIGNLYKEAA